MQEYAVLFTTMQGRRSCSGSFWRGLLLHNSLQVSAAEELQGVKTQLGEIHQITSVQAEIRDDE
jgi:hypothetical protein